MGTPAMKSALNILAAFREFDYIPIQVATPEKKSNPKVEDKDNYEYEMQWNCNEDNNDNWNRCSVSCNINFLVRLKCEMLKELINKYDYAGARILAYTIKGELNPVFIELLDAAVERDRLNYKKANSVFKKYGYKLTEEERSDYSDIAEFFLFIGLKKSKGEYSDFLRAITPLLVNVFKKLLKDRVKVDVDSYVREDHGVKKWDINKLDNSPEIKKILDSKYNPMKSQPVYSDHLVTILSALLSDNKEIKVCGELREIEKQVRNLAAHEIIAVDDNRICSKTGFTTEQIISKVLYIMKLTKINISNDFLNSYDKMNDFIIKKMEI